MAADSFEHWTAVPQPCCCGKPGWQLLAEECSPRLPPVTRAPPAAPARCGPGALPSLAWRCAPPMPPPAWHASHDARRYSAPLPHTPDADRAATAAPTHHTPVPHSPAVHAAPASKPDSTTTGSPPHTPATRSSDP